MIGQAAENVQVLPLRHQRRHKGYNGIVDRIGGVVERDYEVFGKAALQ